MFPAHDVSVRELRVLLDGLIEEPYRLEVALLRVLVEEVARLEEELVGLRVLGAVPAEGALLRLREPQAEPVGDVRRDLVLHAEQVRERPVVFVAPEARARRDVHQLRRDREAAVPPGDRSREDGADAQLSARLPRVRGALEAKDRGAGHDRERRHARHLVDQALGDAVAQVLAVGIARAVLERQDRERLDRGGARGAGGSRGPPRGPRGRREPVLRGRPASARRRLGRGGGSTAGPRSDGPHCVRGLVREVLDVPARSRVEAIAILRVLGEASLDDPAHARGNDVIGRMRAGRVFPHDRNERLGRRGLSPGPAPGHELVEDRAEGKLVRAEVHDASRGLLGRHVADRSEKRARLGGGRRGHRRLVVALGAGERRGLGKAEIEDLDDAVRRQDHVLGLQVPVDDASRVRGGQAVGDLASRSGAPSEGAACRRREAVCRLMPSRSSIDR